MKNRSTIALRILVFGFVASLLIGTPVPIRAADAPGKAASDKIFSPLDLEALRGVRNELITVEGTIERSGESKSKTVRFLNFSKDYRDSLSLVFFLSKGGDAFAMEKLHQWIGKKVRVNGKVTEYGSQMQIEIEKWDQIKEIK